MDQAKWIAARKLVNDRDGGLCVRCGSEATDIHHRQLRGLGGSSDPETNYNPANLVSLCRSCHDYVHQNPDAGYQSGLLVHSWETPALRPVLLANDTIVLYFGSDGTVSKYQQQALF